MDRSAGVQKLPDAPRRDATSPNHHDQAVAEVNGERKA